MDAFLQSIDLHSKPSAEQHFSFFLYNHLNQLEENIHYEDVYLHEADIHHFNQYIENQTTRAIFISQLQVYYQWRHAFLEKYEAAPWNYVKPIIWKDNGKSPYFIEKLTLSHRFEIYIDEQFKRRNVDIGLYYSRDEQYHEGENKLGIEIKRDSVSLQTGNLYIEYEERRTTAGNWVESGILKADNTNYFLIGDMDQFFILRKALLLDMYEDVANHNGQKYPELTKKQAKRGTSLGFIIPITVAQKLSLSIDDVVAEITANTTS